MEPAQPPRGDPAIELLVDLAVYAPVGLIVTLRDDLPKQVRQRRQAVENRVQLARFIGRLAVEQGRKEIARRLEEARRPAEQVESRLDTPPVPEPVVPPAPAAVPEPVEPVEPVEAGVEPVSPEIDAASLPIAGYESLAAIHVVQRLATLGSDELEQIRRFEEAHRARRTILAKIDQLQDRV